MAMGTTERWSHPAAEPAAGSRVICSRTPLLSIAGATLVVAPFEIHAFVQRFRHSAELRIALPAIEPDLYRVLAVQNFWLEDDDPDLDTALAGVFLARRLSDGGWERPENWPVECRTLCTLGQVDARTLQCGPPAPA